MKAAAFEYVRPGSLAEALRLLAEGDDARVIAGGQSLVPALNLRLMAPRLLVDIGRLGELRGVARDGGVLRLGALVRHAELLTDGVIAEAAPLLRAAAAHIAHPAIRSRGTLGGSLSHADPAAELPACCVALEAVMVARSVRGERRIGADDFFTGLFQTALAADEVLVAVEVPESGARFGFAELARRRGDYALAGLAAVGERLAFFAVGAGPVLAQRAAAALRTDGLAGAMAALGDDLAPPSDLQADGATRLHWARVLLRRVVGAMA